MLEGNEILIEAIKTKLEINAIQEVYSYKDTIVIRFTDTPRGEFEIDLAQIQLERAKINLIRYPKTSLQLQIEVDSFIKNSRCLESITNIEKDVAAKIKNIKNKSSDLTHRIHKLQAFQSTAKNYSNSFRLFKKSKPVINLNLDPDIVNNFLTVFKQIKFCAIHSTSNSEIILKTGALVAPKFADIKNTGFTGNSDEDRQEEGYVFLYLIPYSKRKKPLGYSLANGGNLSTLIFDLDTILTVENMITIRMFEGMHYANSTYRPPQQFGKVILQEKYVNNFPIDQSYVHRKYSTSDDEIVVQTTYGDEYLRRPECYREELARQILKRIEIISQLDPNFQAEFYSIYQKVSLQSMTQQLEFAEELFGKFFEAVEILIPEGLSFQYREKKLLLETKTFSEELITQYFNTYQTLKQVITAKNTGRIKSVFNDLMRVLKTHPDLVSLLLNEEEKSDLLRSLIDLIEDDNLCADFVRRLFTEFYDYLNVNTTFFAFKVDKSIKNKTITPNFATTYLLQAVLKRKTKTVQILLDLNANPHFHCIYAYKATGEIISPLTVAKDTLNFEILQLLSLKMGAHCVVEAPFPIYRHSDDLDFRALDLLVKIMADDALQIGYDRDTKTLFFNAKVSQGTNSYGHVHSTLSTLIPHALGFRCITNIDSSQIPVKELGLDRFSIKLGIDTKKTSPFFQHDYFESIRDVLVRLLTRHFDTKLTAAQNQFYKNQSGLDHPFTGSGAMSGRNILKEHRLVGFDIAVKLDKDNKIWITVIDTNQYQHLKLVLHYLKMSHPDLEKKIIYKNSKILIDTDLMSFLLKEKLDLVKYMGLLHVDDSDFTEKFAISKRVEAGEYVNSTRGRVYINLGYTTPGGFNNQPGFIEEAVAKTSLNEFKLNISNLTEIYKKNGLALYRILQGESKIQADSDEFDPSTSCYLTINDIIDQGLLLRDLPTFDHYFHYYILPELKESLLNLNAKVFQKAEVMVYTYSERVLTEFEVSLRKLPVNYGEIRIYIKREADMDKEILAELRSLRDMVRKQFPSEAVRNNAVTIKQNERHFVLVLNRMASLKILNVLHHTTKMELEEEIALPRQPKNHDESLNFVIEEQIKEVILHRIMDMSPILSALESYLKHLHKLSFDELLGVINKPDFIKGLKLCLNVRDKELRSTSVNAYVKFFASLFLKNDIEDHYKKTLYDASPKYLRMFLNDVLQQIFIKNIQKISRDHAKLILQLPIPTQRRDNGNVLTLAAIAISNKREDLYDILENPYSNLKEEMETGTHPSKP